MAKRILKWWFGLFISIPLLVLFLPLIYVAVLALAFILPPALFIVTLFEDREEYKIRNLKQAITNYFLLLIVLPLGLLAFAAPIHSVILATVSFFPTASIKFYEFHSPFYELFIPIFGDLFPYWLNYYWGIYGMIFIFTMALMDSIRRNMLVRQIEILPTSKIHAAAIGLIELKGKAWHVNAKPADDLVPIIRRWVDSSDDGYSIQTSAHRFYLDDGTGRVLVDPKDCHVSSDDSHFEVKLHHAVLKTEKVAHNDFRESRLMHGDEVYVLGNLQIIDKEYRKSFPDDTVIIKPQKSSLLHPSFYDLLFISNTSEEELLALFKKSINRGWVTVFIIMLITAWMSIFAWSNIAQLENNELDAAPALFRLLSPPTTLERQYTIEDLGINSNLQWLNHLEQGHAVSDDIVYGFQEQGLESLAIPVLLKQARNIDDDNFAVANHWLEKLHVRPADQWGIEFFNKKYKNKKETLVLRVLLKFDGHSLYASYRAKFDRKKSSKFELLRRYVVFEFTNKETGIVKTRKLAAKESWNAVDDVEVFEFFLPGEYSFNMYAESEYRGGAKDKGSRMRKAFDVSLY
ncbi:MAG: hypothetical protein HN764_02340 [Gammaproteobacteria bacterium]|nr:hypothetical protein [Gammaproteobacteria bacterium]